MVPMSLGHSFKVQPRLFSTVKLRFFSSLQQTTTQPDNQELPCEPNSHLHHIKDDYYNIPSSVLAKLGRNLHRIPGHPLHLIWQQIVSYFSTPRSAFPWPLSATSTSSPLSVSTSSPLVHFKTFDAISPIVTVQQNFNDLCFPDTHLSRRPSDTYYINRSTLLRTHTSAHEVELLQQADAFVHTGDVYRRDEIDAVHYPVFHQTEVVRKFSPLQVAALKASFANGRLMPCQSLEQAAQAGHDPNIVQWIAYDLKQEVEGLIKALFGPKIEFEWISGEFPFTFPSFELEIFFKGKRLELCGSGILQQSILERANHGQPTDSLAWAVGFGLERLAMILFDIPDIRLFWSQDSRFLDQFKDLSLSTPHMKFKPFSKYPHILRDLSFWLPPVQQHHHTSTLFCENACFEVIREEAGDLVEHVSIIDRFTRPTTGETSFCFRIIYRSMSRSLTDAEVNKLHQAISEKFVALFHVTLR